MLIDGAGAIAPVLRVQGEDMSQLGSLIHIADDEDGEIHVYQDDRHRYLTFGNQVEQSCMDLANPARLVHVYTQAMMLALLFGTEPRDALLLGVGGGSLARALRRVRPGMRITGVDAREAVIDTARSHFELPTDKNLRVVRQDAREFLGQRSRGYDLIFADLYRADGVHPDQGDEGFLRLVRSHLSPVGILVTNQWASEYAPTHDASLKLDGAFDGQVIRLHVQGGNIISFAFNGELPDLQRNDFFERARSAGAKLDIPLERQARNLWRQNAETLGVGRFRNRTRRDSPGGGR